MCKSSVMRCLKNGLNLSPSSSCVTCLRTPEVELLRRLIETRGVCGERKSETFVKHFLLGDFLVNPDSQQHMKGTETERYVVNKEYE